MSTNNLEYTAEDLISHKLQRNGVLIAKPKFDIHGTDLLAFIEFDDSVKYGRVQCKGRTLCPDQRYPAKIEVKKEYVKGAFFVFIYFDVGVDNTSIYLFTVDQIKSVWRTNANGDFVLTVKYDQLTSYNSFLFTEGRMEEIRIIVKNSKSKLEALMLDVVNKQIELNKLTQLHHELEVSVLQVKNSELEIENCNLEMESLQRQIDDIVKMKVELLPQEIIKTIKDINNTSKPYVLNPKIENEVRKFIDDEMLDAVITFIVEKYDTN